MSTQWACEIENIPPPHTPRCISLPFLWMEAREHNEYNDLREILNESGVVEW